VTQTTPSRMLAAVTAVWQASPGPDPRPKVGCPVRLPPSVDDRVADLLQPFRIPLVFSVWRFQTVCAGRACRDRGRAEV